MTEEVKRGRAGFASVDATDDPKRFVRYLVEVSKLPSFVNYKKLTYELLDITEESLVLDAGCGIGIDIKNLAQDHTISRIIGLDSSKQMLVDAREEIPQELQESRKIEFVLGNINSMPFEEGVFDASRIDRTLQYSDDPSSALSEIVRVTRRGGRIVASEPDWSSLTFNGLSLRSAMIINQTFSSIITNPTIGKELVLRFSNVGLHKISSYVSSISLRDTNEAKLILFLDSSLKRAVEGNAIDQKDADECIKEFNSSTNIAVSFDIHVVRGIK